MPRSPGPIQTYVLRAPKVPKQRVSVSPHAGAGPNGRHPNWGHPDHDACGTGFVARLGGPAGYDIIQYALTALERLTHRGGVDADGASGDGAGLLTSLPDDFFRARAKEQGIELPRTFGLGFCFSGASCGERCAFRDRARCGKRAAVALWDGGACRWTRMSLGRRALETMPEIWQFFVEPTQTRENAGAI